MRFVKAAIVFMLAYLAYFTFAPQDLYNPQQVTRVALALALSQGQLDIGEFAAETVDKALHDGRYYADKPPGLSLLAVPAMVVVRNLLERSGSPGDGRDEAGFALYTTAANVTTVSLLGALGAAVLYLLSLRLGASEGGALFAAAGLALGTPYFGWATALFSHVPTGVLLLVALAIALVGELRGAVPRAVAVGLVLGLVLTIDLVAAPAALAVAAVAIASCRAARPQCVLAIGAGAILGLLPLLLYNWAAFDSPFRLGYAQVVGFEGMREGLFGITMPNPVVLMELLFGRYRGLLPLAPVLVVIPLGLFTMWLRGLRTAALAVTTIAACYLLINAGYHYWDGGSSTGPRHLVAMLPVLCLALAFAWPRRPVARVAVLALLAVSLVLSVIAASTIMFAGANYPDPLADLLLPRFLSGNGLLSAARIAPVWLGFAVLAAHAGLRSQRNQLAA